MTSRVSKQKNPPRPPLSAAEAELATAEALESLRAVATPEHRAGLSRFGIPSEHALGVPMKAIQALAKEMGRSQEVAELLWQSEILEARLLTAYVGEPERLSARQMDAWCADFDNWALVDTLCFCLFDRTPHALGRITAWAKKKGEFERRAAFALLASVSAHRDDIGDTALLAFLPICQAHAADGRNFVKKGISWALRHLGGRSSTLRAPVFALAEELAAAPEASARWIGRDVLHWLQRK